MPHDSILRGPFHTLVREGDRASALRVAADGTILELFAPGAPLPRDLEIRDLGGEAILPAFTDSHVHLMPKAALEALAFRLSSLEEGRVLPDSLEALRQRLLAEAEARPRGMVMGYGLFVAGLAERRLPRAGELDAWLPGREVILLSLDGHSSSYSTPMLTRLRLASIAEEGILTGEAHEFNMGRVTDYAMSRLGLSEIVRGITAVVEEAAASGIACIHCLEGFDDSARDPGTGLLALLGPRLPIDLRLYLQYKDIERMTRHAKLLRSPRVGGCLAWEMDGSVSSRSAAMDRPFLDRPSSGQHATGRLYRSPEEATSLVAPFVAAGYQTAAHAIGPRAIESILLAYEGLLDGAGEGNPLRLRIEHFEFPRPDQIERAGRRKLVVSVQPGFAWIDSRHLHAYEEALDKATLDSICPLRSLVEAGCVLSLSTDAPVQPLDPFAQIAGTVEHPVASERLTVFEALRAYSQGGAYAAFDEKERGTLEVGKRADLAVLDRDPFAVPTNELWETRCLATIKDGRPLVAPPAGLVGFAATALMAKRRRM